MDRNDTSGKRPDPETQAAAESVEEQLEESLKPIDSEAEAEAVVEKLAEDARGKTAGEAAQQVPRAEDAPSAAQAAKAAKTVEEAAADQENAVEAAAAVVESTAAAAAALEEDDAAAATAIEQAIHEPFWYEEPEGHERPRRLLLDAFLRHRSIPYLQRLDAEIFLWANVTFPHPPALNRFFRFVALIFRNGWAWQAGMLLCLPVHPRRMWQILKWAVPSIYLASLIVEKPVKWYFQRRRPFLSIVRSVIIGARPSSWSFPSGHAAAAFAGGHALSKLVPRLRPLWYAIASLVGFCRMYLGAHYPSDVLAGGLFGVGITEFTFWLLRRLGLKQT